MTPPPAEGDKIVLDSRTLGLNDSNVVTQPEIEVDPIELRREGIRRYLAIGFAAVTALAGLGYVLAAILISESKWQQASGALNTVFTALVGLTGGIVGFYFSSKQR